MRAAVAEGLGELGITVDGARNAVRSKQPRVISPDGSRVVVAVVPTNEELAIARQTAQLVRDAALGHLSGGVQASRRASR